jgi:hypothetical protein
MWLEGDIIKEVQQRSKEKPEKKAQGQSPRVAEVIG